MSDPVAASGAHNQVETLYKNSESQRDNDPTAFMNVLDQGLNTLAQRPDMGTQANDMVDSLSADYSGNVGEAKFEIVGGEMARAERSSEANNVSLEDRVKSLYTELTHYQVAWKIAQNVQRDISQVLRGS